MSVRTDRAAKEVQRALSDIMLTVASEMHAGLITVTSVRMSPDLRIANTYLSIFGGKTSAADVMLGLENRKAEIRMELGAKVRMRFVPEIRFFLDDTLDQMEHIHDLITKAENNVNPIDESALSRKR
jgi:ribosome-binding factor A